MKKNHLHIYLCIYCFLCPVLLPRDPHFHLLLLSFSWRAACGIPLVLICQQWILSFLLISTPSLENTVCMQDTGGLCPSFSTTASGCQGPTISKAMGRFSAAFKILSSPLVFGHFRRCCRQFSFAYAVWSSPIFLHLYTCESHHTGKLFSHSLSSLLGLWSLHLIFFLSCSVDSCLLAGVFSTLTLNVITDMIFRFTT